MIRKSLLTFLFFVLPLYHSTTLSLLHAQVDLYPFPKIEEPKMKDVKESKSPEPFIQALSKRMNVPPNILTDATGRGMGRTELIRLILISKKSQKPLEDLIKEREKGTRLAKIAEAAQLNNRVIREEAKRILKETETEEAKIKLELKRSTTAMAGIMETLTKNGTRYSVLDATGAAQSLKDESATGSPPKKLDK